MRMKLAIISIVLIAVTIVYAANVKWSALDECTTVADADVLCIIDSGTSKKITVLNFFDTIDTAAELDTIVADENILIETEIDASSELLAIMDDETGTGVLVFGTAPTFTTNITTPQVTFTDADASPDAVGELLYDNTVAGIDDGWFCWYDDDEIKYIIDTDTLPTDAEDDYHLAYDKDTDTLYWKADADTGGATAWDDITNPDADDTIALAGYEIGFSSTLDEAAHAVFKIDHTDADVAAATTIFQIQSVDDGDASLTYINIIDDSGGTPNQIWYIKENGDTHIDGGVYASILQATATVTAGTSVSSDLFDVVGAEDLDIGSADVLDITLIEADSTVVIDGGITVSTGDTITLGATAWNSGDGIDGEVIANDTIDNDSIDWADMTDLTTDGAVSWGNIAEGELADSTVIGADIKDDTVDSADYAAASIDAEHLAADIVSEAYIADNGIDSEHYNDGSIDLVHVAAAAYAKDLVTTAPITGAADNIFVGADSDVTVAITMLKDIVTTAPLTGAEDNVLPGADADLTLAITVLKDLVTTAPITGGTDDIFPGADADITIALAADGIDSVHYAAGSIDYEHLADDVISGAAAIGAFESGDTFLILEAGVGLREADYDDLPGVGGGMDNFIAEDGDGTEVSVSDAEEWKFVEGSGIDINWTDVDPGSDADPFDLTFTVALGTDIAAAEMADEDHGDVQWNSGDADVESMDLGDATTGTYYVGLFADDTGTSRPIYADAPLSYAQATGTLTAGEFAGGGGSLTGVDAATGDSATAFFDAGTIEHEYGGLQADVSAYTGIIGITGADTTVEVDLLSELLTAMGDVTAFITDDDMPAAAADPDVDAAGEIGRDTDGANETGDSSLRGHDGSNQFLYSRKLKTINFTLISPDTIDAADLIPVWHNTSGMTFTITEWKAWSDDDDVSLEIEELTDQTDYSARTTVDAVEIATDGTGVYYASDGTITHAAIETDHSLAIDFDTSDTPDYVQISITGWFNADVD